MKVSKNASIDIELLNKMLKKEKRFSKAVTEAVELWLSEKEKQKAPERHPILKCGDIGRIPKFYYKDGKYADEVIMAKELS